MAAVVLCLSAAGLLAGESQPLAKVNASADNVIEAFVNANKFGDAGLLNAVLNPGAVIRLNRGAQVITQSKSDLVAFYKRSGGVEMNCKADYKILSASDNTVTARIDFSFPEFVQQHFVTIEKDRKGRWKITQISKFSA